jgi:demethylmenaquinone methyltransferase / 2-methoxy-6-polyprenyl-1,4-benzoquinol methylase
VHDLVMSEAVKELFAQIAPRYDLLNRVLSARNDVRWRRRALGLVQGAPENVLDLACGTFDLALTALALGKAARVHGSDFCLPMLVAGAAKRQGQALSACVGDALRLPYASGAFDLAMVAYGWRNFGDPAAALGELKRVLRPGGQLLILEFLRPAGWWPRLFYATFGRVVFPLAGGALAGNAGAYRYLNQSIAGFLSRAEAADLLHAAGFGELRWLSFCGGISHAVAATLPAHPLADPAQR